MKLITSTSNARVGKRIERVEDGVTYTLEVTEVLDARLLKPGNLWVRVRMVR